MTAIRDALRPALPDDAGTAAWAGRVWRPDVGGPSVVAARDGDLFDISPNLSHHAGSVRDGCSGGRLRGAASESAAWRCMLANTPVDGRDRSKPWLLAPIDLQAIKAAGVTFAHLDAGARDRGTRPRRHERGRRNPRRGERAWWVTIWRS